MKINGHTIMKVTITCLVDPNYTSHIPAPAYHEVPSTDHSESHLKAVQKAEVRLTMKLPLVSKSQVDEP